MDHPKRVWTSIIHQPSHQPTDYRPHSTIFFVANPTSMNTNPTELSSGLPAQSIDPESVYSPLHSLANKLSTLPSSSSISNIDASYQPPTFDTPSGFVPLDMFAASPRPDNYSDDDNDEEEEEVEVEEAEKTTEYEEGKTIRTRQWKQNAHTDEEDDYQRRFTIGSVKVHTPNICESEKGVDLRDSYFDGPDQKTAQYSHLQKTLFSRPSHVRDCLEEEIDEGATVTRRDSDVPLSAAFGPRIRKFDESPPWETDEDSSGSSLVPLGPLVSSSVFHGMKLSQSPSSSESDPLSPCSELANMSVRTTPRSLEVITPDGAAYTSPSFLPGASSPEIPSVSSPSGRKEKEKAKLKGSIGGLWKGFGERIRGKRGEESSMDGLGFEFNSPSRSGSRGSNNQLFEGEARGETTVENSLEEARTDQNDDEILSNRQTLLLSPPKITRTVKTPLSPSSPLAYTQSAHNLSLPFPAFSTSCPPSPSSPNRRPSGMYSFSGPMAGPHAYAPHSALSSPGSITSFRTGLETNLGPNGCPIGTLEGGFKLIPLDEALKRKNALSQASSRENLRESRPSRTGSVGGSLRKLFSGNVRGETDRDDTQGGTSAPEGETESRGLTPSSSTSSFSKLSPSFISSPVKREILRASNRYDGDDIKRNQPSPPEEEDTPRLLGSPKLRTMCSMGSLTEEDYSGDDDDDDDDDYRRRKGDGWAKVSQLKIEHARERAAWNKKTADYQNQIQMLQRLLKEATDQDSGNPPLTPVWTD